MPIASDRGSPVIPVVLLFGPTASGKTAILEQLFAGKEAPIPAEIISADSMQVYRGMDIGTAKPASDLRARLPHHLIDICDIKEQFTVGDFVRHANVACIDIFRRGKLPVVSGGTGFYLKNFVLGLPAAPPSDAEIRTILKRELSEFGLEPLLRELRQADPVSAQRIHPNDTYRLLRALEVFRLTGRPLSSYPISGHSGQNGVVERPSYQFLLIGIERNREELYERINQRTRRMFQQGLPEEVSRLVAQGYTRDDPGMRAIGYQEFFMEDGQLSTDMELIEMLVARNSRRYAKRQITFFKALPGVHWIPGEDPEISEKVRECMESVMSKNKI